MWTLLVCRARKGRILSYFRVAGILTVGLSALALAQRAEAVGSPITIPSSTAVGIGLASAANYKVTQDTQWKDYEDVVILAALNGVAKASANAGQPMTAANYTSVVNQLRTWLNSKSPQNPVFADEAACLRYAIDALVPVLNSGPASPFLSTSLAGLENVKLTQLESSLDPSRQYPADMGLSSLSQNAYQFIADRVQEASDLAHNDLQYAVAINPVLFDLLGLDSTATYAQIQSLYPNAVPTLPAPNNDGSFTFNPADLITQYQSIIGSVQSAIDADLTSLEAAIGSSQMVRSQLVSAQASASSGCVAGAILISANQCTGANNNVETQAQSTITGLSKLVGLSDSTLGTQISNVGGAVIQAGKAIGQLGVLGSESGAVLGALGSTLGVFGPVGALAGAGITIFSSLFGGGSSNPNAAVLAQIQKLSQQITRLQTDMDNQFKQVNATLSTILTTLTQNFAQINYQLGVLNGDVHAIQVGLLDVQTQLNQLAVYSLAYAQTQEYETLIQYLNGCLNYRTVHNGADIGLTQYNTCENELFTWANNDVTDQLWAGVQQPNYSDGNIYNIFLNSAVTGVCSGCASPFSTDVNYLAQFSAQNLNLPALANTRLPNPDMWTLVARAYLQLAREWPQYAVTINSVHFDDLIQVGTSLQQANHKANSTGSGAGIVTNQPLFNSVINKYNAAISGLQSAVQGVTNTFVSDPNRRLQGLNLWAGSGQQTSFSPQVLSNSTMPPCSINFINFKTPLNSAPLIPMQVRLAEQLGLGVLSLCYNIELSNVRPSQPGEFGYPNTIFSTMKFSILGRFGGQEVFRRMLPLFNSTLFCNSLSCTVTDGPDPTVTRSGPAYWMDFFWQDSNHFGNTNLYYQSFATVSIDDSVNQSLRAQNLLNLSVSIDTTLAGYEQTLYGQIASIFSAAGPVQAAGQFLSATKVLAEAYVNLGLPTSLGTNDTLHGLLYGKGSIFDASTVQSDLASFSSSPISNNTDNRITDEIANLNSRSTALATAFNGALSSIQQSGSPDSLAPIDATLQDLQAFETLKNANALSACSYQLSAGSSSIGTSGGSVTITVNSVSGCGLIANSGAPWVNVSTTPIGPGQFQVSITITADPSGSARSGIVIIGDQIYRVYQDTSPTTCTYSLTASSASLGAGASSGMVGVIVGAGCTWTVTNPQPGWLTITSGSSGSGNGTVNYSVLANATSSSRMAMLTIAGLPFTVTQAASTTASAVSRDTAGSIRLSTYASSTLSNSGGVFASDPSAAQDLNGNTFVTARDNFNSIWANVYNASTSTWSGWRLGSGIIQGVPSIAIDTSGTGWIAARDNYNSYWLVSFTTGSGFSTWTPLLGIFSTDPVVTACGDGSISLIGKDNFNSLWSGHYIPGTGFQGWQFGGGIIKGKPAATCGGDNAVYVVAEDNFNSNWMARVAGKTHGPGGSMGEQSRV